MHAHGQNILGIGPGMERPGGKRDRQTSVVSRARAAGSRAVQLGRSSAGAR